MKNEIKYLDSKEIYDFVKSIIMPEVFIYSYEEFCQKCLTKDKLFGNPICKFVIEKTSLAGTVVELEFLHHNVRNVSGTKICFDFHDHLIDLQYQKLMLKKNGKDSAYAKSLMEVFEKKKSYAEEDYQRAISFAQLKKEEKFNSIEKDMNFVFETTANKTKEF